MPVFVHDRGYLTTGEPPRTPLPRRPLKRIGRKFVVDTELEAAHERNRQERARLAEEARSMAALQENRLMDELVSAIMARGGLVSQAALEEALGEVRTLRERLSATEIELGLLKAQAEQITIRGD